jgi:hypothetical protein
MKRKKPSFNEGYYGFRTFSHLLEDAQRRGIVKLRRDQRSGSYIIEDLGEAAPTDVAAPASATPAEAAATDSEGTKSTSRRRRSRGGRRTRAAAPAAAGADTEAAVSDDGDDEDEAPAASPPPATGAREGESRAAAPERGTSFSLFSWLRREPEEPGAEEDKKP